MITQTAWHCPEGLIEQALKECPISDKSTVLNEQTGQFFYDQWIINNTYKDTLWQQVLDTLPGNVGQARIIKLEPGESYLAHADIDNRWHLNLSGERSYLVDLDDNVMYNCKRDNCWAYMDASRIHSATNYGSVPRLQLVVRELLIKNSHLENMVSISITSAQDTNRFRYKFDNLVSPWLNRVNQKHKLSNFTTDFSSVNFKLERELVEDLQSLLTDDYKLTIHTV